MVFGGIIIAIYSLFFNKLMSIKQAVTIVFIGIILNFYWLLNFFVSQSISSVSTTAKAVSFSGSSYLDVVNIFNLSFSKATLIHKFFDNTILILNSLIFIIIITTWLLTDKPTKTAVYIRVSMIVFMAFTIFANLLSLVPGVNVIYPMFREVGHMAPLVLFFLFLSLSWNNSSKILMPIITVIILFMVISSASIFYKMAPALNFAETRSELEPFRHYTEIMDLNRSDRILIYPYFKPFGFNSVKILESDGFMLNNSSADSFSTFSNARFAPNAVSPSELKNSIQYALHSTQDANFLRYYGVSHIFDMSSIYESYIDKYIPAELYNNDLNLIKTDETYVQRLKNLSNFKNGIHSVKDYLPYIHSFKAISVINASSSPLLVAEADHTTLISGPFVFSDSLSNKDNILQNNTNILPIGLSTDSELIPYEDTNLLHTQKASQSIFYIDDGYVKYVDIAKHNTPRFIIYPDSYTLSTSTDNTEFVLSTNNNFTSYKYAELPNDVTSILFTSTTTKISNVIENGSFEQGLWKNKVEDCFNYDEDADIEMGLDNIEHIDGNYSLKLSATKHVACTSKIIEVTPGITTYMLAFNYKSEMIGSNIGLSIALNTDGSDDLNYQFVSNTEEWQTYTKLISIPSYVKNIKLYLYSYQSDRKTKNIINYDNISLTPISIIDNTFIVSGKNPNLDQPKETTFDLINPTKKLVHIKGATTPFYLAMSESYHDKWQAQFNNEKINGFFKSWVPFVEPDTIPNEHHFELNGFLNGWYIDTKEYCKNKNLCTQNPDGSYDMELVLEFFPQRWFYLGLLISAITFIGLIGYLIFDFVRTRKERKRKREDKVI